MNVIIAIVLALIIFFALPFLGHIIAFVLIWGIALMLCVALPLVIVIGLAKGILEVLNLTRK